MLVTALTRVHNGCLRLEGQKIGPRFQLRSDMNAQVELLASSPRLALKLTVDNPFRRSTCSRLRRVTGARLTFRAATFTRQRFREPHLVQCRRETAAGRAKTGTSEDSRQSATSARCRSPWSLTPRDRELRQGDLGQRRELVPRARPLRAGGLLAA
jgi:hypothetical protein